MVEMRQYGWRVYVCVCVCVCVVAVVTMQVSAPAANRGLIGLGAWPQLSPTTGLNHPTQPSHTLTSAKLQLIAASAALDSAKEDLRRCTLLSDAAALRQSLCAQAVPVLDALERVHRQAAQASLAAVEAEEKVRCSFSLRARQ